MHPALVDEDQPLRLNRPSHHHPPGCSSENSSRSAADRPPFSCSIRSGVYGAADRRATHREPRKGVYVVAAVARVAKALSLSTSGRTFVAFSSSSAAGAGPFFG